MEREVQARMSRSKKSRQVSESLELILRQYGDSFRSKSYGDENEDIDPLMDVFGITPELKRENRQYWGRELGMCWQLIVTRTFEICRGPDFRPGYRSGADEMCDLMVGGMAIDTKYRIGSGDSGTLKKFKQYGAELTNLGFDPVLLVLRRDNLPAAIQACKSGGWRTIIGQDSFDFIKSASRFDMLDFLNKAARRHLVVRKPRSV